MEKRDGLMESASQHEASSGSALKEAGTVKQNGMAVLIHSARRFNYMYRDSKGLFLTFCSQKA